MSRPAPPSLTICFWSRRPVGAVHPSFRLAAWMYALSSLSSSHTSRPHTMSSSPPRSSGRMMLVVCRISTSLPSPLIFALCTSACSSIVVSVSSCRALWHFACFLIQKHILRSLSGKLRPLFRRFSEDSEDSQPRIAVPAFLFVSSPNGADVVTAVLLIARCSRKLVLNPSHHPSNHFAASFFLCGSTSI